MVGGSSSPSKFRSVMRLAWFKTMALCAMIATSLGLSPALLAQSDLTTVTGIVRDSSGAVVPDATVTVKNEATNTERKATTNPNGGYTIVNVPAGAYTLQVESTGFKRFEQTGI